MSTAQVQRKQLVSFVHQQKAKIDLVAQRHTNNIDLVDIKFPLFEVWDTLIRNLGLQFSFLKDADLFREMKITMLLFNGPFVKCLIFLSLFRLIEMLIFDNIGFCGPIILVKHP